jgi:hypothetical protein
MRENRSSRLANFQAGQRSVLRLCSLEGISALFEFPVPIRAFAVEFRDRLLSARVQAYR